MFDETPRLFSVADILQKRKNKDDDYEFEDFPDTKEYHTTGKYDNNFDALGSEFERAHNYDFNNVKQPENTETDIEFSDYYDRLLKYEPSSYIKLEEDEIIPFSINNDKPNEYYIDDLKGKTFDDLVISKMKENAGAEDLPRDAMRRKFAEDMIRNKEVEITARVHSDAGVTEHNHLGSVLQELKKNKKNGNIVIEAPLSSRNKSARIQGISADPVPEKASKRKNKKEKASSSSASVDSPILTDEEIQASPLVQNIIKKSRKQSLGDILQRNEDRQSLKTAFDKLKNVPPKKTSGVETKDSINDIGGGGASGDGPSDGKDKKGKDKDKDKKDEKDEKDDNNVR